MSSHGLRGTTFGRYLLTERLARGGMAELFLARLHSDPPATAIPLVIKRIRSDRAADPDFVELFTQEARIASELRHPNIVEVHDVDRVAGVPFFAMEFIDGLDLMRLYRAIRGAGEGFPPAVAGFIGHGVASALAYAHRRGTEAPVVHGDITPHNIMLGRDGRIKLLDFGIARRADHELSSRSKGGIRGKVAYMSPEQAQGHDIDPRTDVYALGTVLFELVTGKLLFRMPDPMAALRRVAQHTPQPVRRLLPSVPQPLAEIIDCARARDPEDRYPDASLLADALAAYLRSTSPPSTGADLAKFVCHYAPPRASTAHDPTAGPRPSPAARPPELWHRELDDVSAPERDLLSAAALLGPRGEVDALAAITGCTEATIRPVLALLEQRNFVTLEGTRWQFVDEELLEICRASTTPTTWTRLHDKARPWLQANIDRLRASGRLREALQLCQQARHVARISGEDEGHWLRTSAELLFALDRLPDALTSLRMALRVDRERGDPRASAQTLERLGFIYGRVGLGRVAERTLRRAITIESAIHAPRAVLLLRLGEVLAELGQRDDARQALANAAQRAHAEGDTATAVRAAVAEYLLLSPTSTYAHDTARQLVRRTVHLADEDLLVEVLYGLTCAAADVGATRDARRYAEHAKILIDRGHGTWQAPLLLARLGELDPDSGATQRGRTLIETRLAALRLPVLQRAYRNRPGVRRLLADSRQPTRG